MHCKLLILFRNEKVASSNLACGSKAKIKKFSQLDNWLSFFVLLNFS